VKQAGFNNQYITFLGGITLPNHSPASLRHPALYNNPFLPGLPGRTFIGTL